VPHHLSQTEPIIKNLILKTKMSLSYIPTSLWYLFFIAVTLRFCLAVALPTSNSPEHWADASNYHFIAKSLVEGQGYSMGDGEPTRVRPPAYPVFLALIYAITGPRHEIAVCIQALCGVFTVFFAYFLGLRIFDKRAGLLAAFIVATYPAFIYYDTRLLREGFTAVLVTAIFYFVIDTPLKRQTNKRALWVGILLATASMSRPELLLLVLPVSYLLVRPLNKRQMFWRPILLVGLPILLVWVPWTVRNYVYFGSVSPVNKGLGSVLWFGNRWASINGDSHLQEDRTALQKLTKERFTNLSDNEQEKRNMAAAIEDMKSRPTWFLSMIAKKVELFWRDANGVKKTLPKIHSSLPYLLNTYYYTLLLLALSTSLWLHRKREWVLPLFATVMTYMMIYALLHVRNRYRVPILPIVFVLSAGGFWALYDQIKNWILNHNPTTS